MPFQIPEVPQYPYADMPEDDEELGDEESPDQSSGQKKEDKPSAKDAKDTADKLSKGGLKPPAGGAGASTGAGAGAGAASGAAATAGTAILPTATVADICSGVMCFPAILKYGLAFQLSAPTARSAASRPSV